MLAATERSEGISILAQGLEKPVGHVGLPRHAPKLSDYFASDYAISCNAMTGLSAGEELSSC